MRIAARIWPEIGVCSSWITVHLVPCLRPAMHQHPLFVGSVHLGVLLLTRFSIHFRE